MAKWKKSLKKGLKKAAPLIMAGLAARSMMGNKGTAFARPKRGTIDQMATDAAMPGNLSPTMGMRGRDSVLASPKWGHWDANYMAKGGRVRGAGKAKRGLGRAFTKRKK